MSEGIQVNVGIRNAGFKKGLEEMREWSRDFKSQIAGMFAGALGFEAVRRSLDFGDKLDDLSQRFNVSASALQELNAVAEENGTSLEAMAKGMNKAEVARSKAIQGDEQLRASFAALGVGIEDLRSLDTAQLMAKIGMSSMDAANMVAVLGKNAMELRPALQAAAEEGARSVSKMSDSDVAALGAVSDAFKQLSTFLGNLIGTIVAGLVKGVESMIAFGVAAQKVVKLTFSGSHSSSELKKILDEFYQDLSDIDAQRDSRKKKGFTAGDEKDPAKEAAAKQEEKDNERRMEHLQRIIDAERLAGIMAMEGQERVNALIEERDKLLTGANADSDEGIKALEDAQKIQREIERSQKQMAEEAARAAKVEEDNAQRKAEQTGEELDREDKLREDIREKQLNPQERIAAEIERAKKLRAEAAAALDGGDEITASKKRQEALRLEEAAREEAVSLDKKPGGREASIKVSAIQSVGGGGSFSAIASDPTTRELQTQSLLLRQLVQYLRDISQQRPSPSRPPFL
jgi:hypothetical protein